MLAYARLRWPLRGILGQRDGYGSPRTSTRRSRSSARFTQPPRSRPSPCRHLLTRRKSGSHAWRSHGACRTVDESRTHQAHPAQDARQARAPDAQCHSTAQALGLVRLRRHHDPLRGRGSRSQAPRLRHHRAQSGDARATSSTLAATPASTPSLAAKATELAVVAVDTDLQTVDHLARKVQPDPGQNVLPLCIDAPARRFRRRLAGNAENSSFLDRANRRPLTWS